ncbi:MAG TPA: AEC family transporter [Candidatus Blautia pullistercoris]|uniref:AEC family transporter n=1 Tax=Candidatus Blautia pullistercoris TaxID=2838499 RepID=A0A9D2ANM3_9FIRM|nr:AEC family transporter [Candidatus Blautia pullistercoris]
MSSLVVLEQMVMIFILILTGFVLYKKKMISDSASKDLSALVVNVCSPGLVIVSMFNDLSQIPRENVIFVGAISVIFYLFLIFFGYFLVWVLKVPGHLKNAYVLMTVFGNTGFIGIPVALAIIGPESMVYVIVFNFLFNLTIFTFGIMLLKKDNQGKKQSWKDYLSPGLLACIAAFAIYWFHIELPEEIETLAGYYGNACTLLSMIVIGISLAGMKVKDMMKNRRLLVFVFIRFIAFPILLALALRPVLSDLLIREVVLLMAVLPVGNFPAMLCEQYGRDPKPIAEGIVVTTILSVFTITLTFMLV